MAQPDVYEQLKSRFMKPLSQGERRRVVIWHDEDGSFEADFERLESEGMGGGLPREVRFARFQEGLLFNAKRRIYRLERDCDFLVYSPRRRDLSGHGLEGNWMADVELVADHFQADHVSMLVEEIGASDSASEGIRQHLDFFKTKKNKDRFVRVVPNAQSRQDVVLGIIASQLESGGVETELLVRTYLCALADGEDPLGSLAKHGVDSPWSLFLSSKIGYAGDLSDAEDLASHLLLTALSFQLPDGALSGLEGRISPSHAQFCLNVVHEWMADEASSDYLYELCRRVEGKCNLPQRFAAAGASYLMEGDVFPCINERILEDLCGSLGAGADRADEAQKVLQRRKDLRWFARVRPQFEALEQAVRIQRFYRAHIQGFHLAKPADVWGAYTEDWFRMDQAYRAFSKALSACQRSSSDLPNAVDDAVDELATWVENVYVNWFLRGSNDCWVNASEEQWAESGYVEGVTRQRRFFEECVAAGGADVKKTLVIISDALRYEVASQLCDRLASDTRGTATLKGMQSVFPSITKFGMPALLPHSSMSFDWKTDSVLVDGNRADTTPQREAVLRARRPDARCVQAKDLISAKRSQRKQMVDGADVVFVYHDKIDATGDKPATERDVFDACETAIDELVGLVRIAVSDLNFIRVVITADHGFLYTRDPLEERDKVSQKDIDANVVKVGRRFAISDTDLADPLFIAMNMEDIDGGTYTGIAPRECIRIKRGGAGDNYVHGGMSLQECCVPVIEYRSSRARNKGFEDKRTAELQLLTTSRRVTSMLFRLDLYQTEPVGGKVLGCEYELTMTDASGNDVSDTRRVHADMTNPDNTARQTCVQLNLKAGHAYDPKKQFFLVCRAKDSSTIAWKEDFQIDIAFVPADDFGF